MDGKSFKAGDLVYLENSDGRKLLRKAVEISGSTVYICTDEEYENAQKAGLKPTCLGVNVEFIEALSRQP